MVFDLIVAYLFFSILIRYHLRCWLFCISDFVMLVVIIINIHWGCVLFVFVVLNQIKYVDLTLFICRYATKKFVGYINVTWRRVCSLFLVAFGVTFRMFSYVTLQFTFYILFDSIAISALSVSNMSDCSCVYVRHFWLVAVTFLIQILYSLLICLAWRQSELFLFCHFALRHVAFTFVVLYFVAFRFLFAMSVL